MTSAELFMLSAVQPVYLVEDEIFSYGTRTASFFNWNRQDILYLQHDSESLGLETSIKYTFEANARQVQGTDQSNVSACRSPDSRVDLFYNVLYHVMMRRILLPARSK